MIESRPIKHRLDPKQSIDSETKFCTICEVQRRLWRLIDREIGDKDLQGKMKALVEEAYDLGKRMDMKLREYKFDYHEGMLERARPQGTYKERLNE